jgi:hypothetical protein
MQIYIKFKQAGKRRLILEKQAIEIEDIGNSPTLRSFIMAVVTQQVGIYNVGTHNVETRHALSLPNTSIINFLTETQIENAVATGKVGFGAIYNDKKADVQKAIQVAIEAYIDGLFVVAVDDKIVEKLDDFIALNEKTVVTFIRLTLLIGR